jgi:predicted nucleic acid-binding protein
MSNHDNIIIVKDSCILFDLIDLELMEEFYRLGLTVYTTQQVIDEITDESQSVAVSKYITTGKLLIDSNGLYDTIVLIYEENRGLSFADSSVLEVAIRREGIVLSSDKSLRNVATRRNLIVRGVLWIIEELCNKGIINVETALNKLKIYSSINQRAPVSEIEKLIQKLKGRNTNF